MAELLRNPIQPYVWGSRTVLAHVQGRPWPTAGPEAELWIGAHSAAPSTVLRGRAHRSLDEVIAADPAAELGVAAAARFGPRLPFLAKLLAIERPLSIQVHPDDAQAAAGYAAQRAAPAAEPTYTDRFGKPELVVTRTLFELLSGVRPVAEAAAALSRLGIGELDRLVATLTDQGSMRGVFSRLLRHENAADLIERVVLACDRAAQLQEAQ
ncbi:MAG: type I phosphomannose isomerase catalytic subunit, partial [Mycobacteriales bacterium]